MCVCVFVIVCICGNQRRLLASHSFPYCFATVFLTELEVDCYRQTTLVLPSLAFICVLKSKLRSLIFCSFHYQLIFCSFVSPACVPCLTHLCRLEIRASLKAEHLRSNSFIHQLPLPRSLQSYLLYEEVLRMNEIPEPAAIHDVESSEASDSSIVSAV